jgi:hypothetical protein
MAVSRARRVAAVIVATATFSLPSAALIDATALVTGAEPDGLLRFGLAYVCSGGQKASDPSSQSPTTRPDAANPSQEPQADGRFLAVSSTVAAIIGAGWLAVITRRRNHP